MSERLISVDKLGESMPRWKKDETRFPVSISANETRGYQATIPKPIVERLADPHHITFVVKGKRITVE
jgi:hypothetical protein